LFAGGLVDCQSARIIADKGYGTEAIRAQVERQGSKVVIARKRNSLEGNANLDQGLYRNRHLVENAFARLKHFRALASRLEKLKRNYESVIAMACASVAANVKREQPVADLELTLDIWFCIWLCVPPA
jgi:transposase